MEEGGKREGLTRSIIEAVPGRSEKLFFSHLEEI
jgi:hypothetical protein